MREAMRAKDTIRLGVIRTIKTKGTLKLKEKGAPDALNDGAFIGIIQRIASDVDKTLEEISKIGGDRAKELCEHASKEREILKSYLPATVSVEKVQQLIDETIELQGAKSVKQMRGVMATMQEHVGGGRFDPKQLGQMVKASLTKD